MSLSQAAYSLTLHLIRTQYTQIKSNVMQHHLAVMRDIKDFSQRVIEEIV